MRKLTPRQKEANISAFKGNLLMRLQTHAEDSSLTNQRPLGLPAPPPTQMTYPLFSEEVIGSLLVAASH